MMLKNKYDALKTLMQDDRTAGLLPNSKGGQQELEILYCTMGGAANARLGMGTTLKIEAVLLRQTGNRCNSRQRH